MASTYLSRTFGTATNRKKFTISLWFKKASNSSNQQFLDTGVDGNNQDGFKIHSSQALKFNGYESGTTYELQSNALLRDSSAWYNAVVSFDSTQSTSTNRLKMYLNGEQITSFSGATYPSLNFEPLMNKNTAHFIGSTFSNSNYFDGAMAMVEFVDGQQYGSEYFGSTDTATGIWKPGGSSTISDYGTNGFKLKMDTTSPGADTSGKSNNFTPSGTPTLTQGSPSNVYATWNPLDNYFANASFLNGNTTILNGANSATNTSTLGMTTGKFYWECKVTQQTQTQLWGIRSGMSTGTGNYLTETTTAGNIGYGLVRSSGNMGYPSGGSESYAGSEIVTNDLLMFALDVDNNKFWIGKNGTWFASGNPSTGSNGYSITASPSGVWLVACNSFGGSNSTTYYNFGEGFFGTTAAGTNADDNGQGLFAYDVPAGYYALNTKNLEAYG